MGKPNSISISRLTRKREKELLEAIGHEQLQNVLERMYVIRAFEEKAEELYGLGKTHGTMHLSIGQEASAMGACTAVKSGHDYLLNHHRGHGNCLAWGGGVDEMMAEFMGRETGYCRGRGGSMHIADVERNNLGANGIVGGGLPMSVGVGLSIRMRNTDQVCLTIFGDGAANTGPFHETLNMASIWDLPVVFLCENNQYAMSMSVVKAFNIEHISQRACAYNIPGESVDGNDYLAVYDAVHRAAERARGGAGPSLVEAITYRWRGHSRSDRQLYRTRNEVKEWQARDPISRLAGKLIEVNWLTDSEQEKIRERAYQRIEAALIFAEQSPAPDISAVMEGLYAD
jgi:TPP-dependent pyruvate/acetoin dehydrogenase alpha subunit